MKRRNPAKIADATVRYLLLAAGTVRLSQATISFSSIPIFSCFKLLLTVVSNVRAPVPTGS